jgi:chorismate mutase
MEDIEKLRERIDEVDENILLSLSDRAKICKAIGILKDKHGFPVKDNKRENDLYMKIRKKATELNLDAEQVEEIYRKIVEMCTSVQ